jgi:hypothetical protein
MDRSPESSPRLPTAVAASKHATAPPHSAGETLENASARQPALILITAEELQHSLDLFAAEPPLPLQPADPPEVDDGILAGFAVEHVSLSADDGDEHDDEDDDDPLEHVSLSADAGDEDDDDPRTRQTWFVPLVAAALTAFVIIGVTMSVRLMRSGAASRIATSNVQPAELAMPAIQTAAPAVDTSRSDPTTPQNGEPISTGVPKDRTREIVAPTVGQALVPRERPTPQAVPSSISPRSPAPLPPSERPVQPVLLAGSFASPVPILEAIGMASLGTLDTSMLPTTVSVEAKPIVPEPATPAVTEAAMPTSRTSASETGAIQGVLGRYRTAFNELDADAARAIWPSLDTKALRRAFEHLEQQNLVFDQCQIAVTDARAVASCGGTARYVPRVGNKTLHDDRRHWEFNLRKIDDVWLIDTVSAR